MSPFAKDCLPSAEQTANGAWRAAGVFSPLWPLSSIWAVGARCLAAGLPAWQGPSQQLEGSAEALAGPGEEQRGLSSSPGAPAMCRHRTGPWDPG